MSKDQNPSDKACDAYFDNPCAATSGSYYSDRVTFYAGFAAGAASRDAEIEGHKGRFAKDQDHIACQAEQLAQKNAEITECDALRDRMSEILSATAIAINGPEPELTKWSWHDLSEKAGALKQQVAELVAALEAMLTHMGMDEDEWNKPTFNQARATLAKVRKP